MPTAGAFAARVSEVAINTVAVTAPETQDPAVLVYNNIEKVNSPRISGSVDVAESSSNDSAGSKEFLPTWDGATLTFEMIADENATQQENVWTAFLNKQCRGWRVRPRGDVGGDRQLFFLGYVSSIEESLDKGDVAKYNVTITKTRAFTRNTQ